MLTKSQVAAAQKRALEFLLKSGVVMSEKERSEIAVADFGLSNLEAEGGQILTFFNTDRISAKEIVLFPRQTLPEHWHPTVGDDPGKEEIMRCRWGEVYVCIEGEATERPKAIVPAGSEAYYTVHKEVVLRPGDQIILPPGLVHWFQAGDEGAVIDYSTTARDILDGFTDPRIVRTTKIAEDSD